MHDLNKGLAPISEAAWARIDDEAKDALEVYLAARKVVRFSGPHGWKKASVPTGKVRGIDGVGDGVTARLRVVQPLVELRVPFTLSRRELESIARGNPKPELGPMIEAARIIAAAEDRLVFMGNEEANIVGIATGSDTEPVTLSEDYLQYPSSIVTAVQRLRDEGVGGPYALVLGPRCYRGLMTTIEGGYPVYHHVRSLVDGPIVHAPSFNGALVMTMDEEAFELVVGRDLSIGYLAHDADSVQLYFEESLTFRLYEPDGGVWLKYA